MQPNVKPDASPRAESDVAPRDKLRDLSMALRDTQLGLTDAAGKSADTNQVRLLHRLAGERAEMEQDLREYVRGPDAKAASKAPWIGDLRTAWRNAKTAMLSRDDAKMLAAVSAGEKLIANEYRRLLEQGEELPTSNLRKILLEHLAKVREGQRALRTVNSHESSERSPGTERRHRTFRKWR